MRKKTDLSCRIMMMMVMVIGVDEYISGNQGCTQRWGGRGLPCSSFPPKAPKTEI
jgi:hypothetical protein